MHNSGLGGSGSGGGISSGLSSGGFGSGLGFSSNTGGFSGSGIGCVLGSFLGGSGSGSGSISSGLVGSFLGDTCVFLGYACSFGSGGIGSSLRFYLLGGNSGGFSFSIKRVPARFSDCFFLSLCPSEPGKFFFGQVVVSEVTQNLLSLLHVDEAAVGVLVKRLADVFSRTLTFSGEIVRHGLHIVVGQFKPRLAEHVDRIEVLVGTDIFASLNGACVVVCIASSELGAISRAQIGVLIKRGHVNLLGAVQELFQRNIITVDILGNYSVVVDHAGCQNTTGHTHTNRTANRTGVLGLIPVHLTHSVVLCGYVLGEFFAPLGDVLLAQFFAKRGRSHLGHVAHESFDHCAISNPA